MFLCRNMQTVFWKKNDCSQQPLQPPFAGFQFPFVTTRQTAAFFSHPAQTLYLVAQCIQREDDLLFFFIFLFFIIVL